MPDLRDRADMLALAGDFREHDPALPYRELISATLPMTAAPTSCSRSGTASDVERLRGGPPPHRAANETSKAWRWKSSSRVRYCGNVFRVTDRAGTSSQAVG